MKNLIALALLVGALWSCSQPKPEATTPAEEPKPQPIEFADAKYSDICKQSLTALASKDVDAFVSSMAENSIYRFNSGDSIVGKAAITTYWKDRMTNAIDKLEFSNDIWLSLKVNESTQGVNTGNWVLGWFQVTASYVTGKSMSQNIHTLYHFNGNGKIDEVIQYMDRAPINAAMIKAKK